MPSETRQNDQLTEPNPRLLKFVNHIHKIERTKKSSVLRSMHTKNLSCSVVISWNCNLKTAILFVMTLWIHWKILQLGHHLFLQNFTSLWNMGEKRWTSSDMLIFCGLESINQLNLNVCHKSLGVVHSWTLSLGPWGFCCAIELSVDKNVDSILWKDKLHTWLWTK
jgi:hypothetical protein